MPKSRVTCVMQRCDTSEKHQSSSVPIFQPNVSNFSTFQFWSLSISVAFLFSVCRQNYVLPLKLKKKRKIFRLLLPLSDLHLLFYRVSITNFTSDLRRHASQFIIIFSVAKRLVDVGCVFSTELYTLTLGSLAMQRTKEAFHIVLSLHLKDKQKL